MQGKRKIYKIMSYEKYYKGFLQENPYSRQLKSYDIKKYINFSSNDYLGLSKHPLLIERSQQYAQEFGVGAVSSRLVTGNLSLYDVIEKKLAAAIGKPAALIFASGYQANTSVLEALFDDRVLGHEPLIFCDRL